jgi:zeta-carotene desaturase
LKTVIVIGGGLAGLSSAVALVDAGFRVRLLEQKPFLGGRASSYDLPSGEQIDNCQHVTLGCCTNLSHFYRRAGAASKIVFYDSLVFVDREGRRSVMEVSSLPAPLHLAPSLALFSFLDWAERRSIGRAMLAIARFGGENANVETEGKSMLDWLRLQGQSPAAIARFWGVVLVSALNEQLDQIDAHYGLDVFWKAFLANRAGYRIGVPSVPLSELYSGCRDAIEQRGGEVACRTAVRGFRVEDARIAAVELDGPRQETADYYVLAVPHEAVPALLPPEVVEQEAVFRNLRNLRSSPIIGVHFWFDRDVMAEPFLTLLDRTTQWIFNKSQLCGGPGEGCYLQLVISASSGLVSRSRQKIIDLCLHELYEVLPEARAADLAKAVVIKEVAATFSPEAGSDRWRPSQRTPISNLFLAGDWTATGWPATMEGAVRSGYLAAEAVLAAAGSPRKLVQADLAVEALARLSTAIGGRWKS